MPRLNILGHPVHPILQAIPASLLPALTTFDVLARLGIDEEGLSKAAHYSFELRPKLRAPGEPQG